MTIRIPSSSGILILVDQAGVAMKFGVHWLMAAKARILIVEFSLQFVLSPSPSLFLSKKKRLAFCERAIARAGTPCSTPFN